MNLKTGTLNTASINNPLESLGALPHDLALRLETIAGKIPVIEVLDIEFFKELKLDEDILLEITKFSKLLSMTMLDFLTSKNIGKCRLVSLPHRNLKCSPNMTLNDVKNLIKNNLAIFDSKPLNPDKYIDLKDTIYVKNKIYNKITQILFLTLYYGIMDFLLKDSITWQKLLHGNRNLIDDKISAYKKWILESNLDIIFLQELSVEFSKKLQIELYDYDYDLFCNNLGVQDSGILIRRSLNLNVISKISYLPEYNGCSPGDLIGLEVKNEKLHMLLFSYHGDSKGLHTLPVMNVIKNYISKRKIPAIIGMDANTCGDTPLEHNNKVKSFISQMNKLHFNTCFSTTNYKFTTGQARSIFQPQFQKGILTRDRNKSTKRYCKDYICSTFELSDGVIYNNQSTVIDYPNERWPSDHTAVNTNIKVS